MQSALRINALFPIGVGLAVVLTWSGAHPLGVIVRMAGDSTDAARALGYSVNTVRMVATMAGGFIAGMAVSRCPCTTREAGTRGCRVVRPRCCGAGDLCPLAARCNVCGHRCSLGGAGALGPALQSVGVSAGYHLFNAMPYALTLLILVWSCKPKQALKGAPGRAEVGALRRAVTKE